MPTASSGPIVASSLSDLNLLAANPPQYPQRPSGVEPQPELTLYISRVPGTRDVILSTLKPQRKNVTAEDIANALYYIHLNLPSDRRLSAASTAAASSAAPRDPTSSSPRSSAEFVRSPVSPIPRKPVPLIRGPAPDLPPPTPPKIPMPMPAATNATIRSQPPTAPPAAGLPPVSATLAATDPSPPVATPPKRHPLPATPSPAGLPQPWVPPGFRLDEGHSFDLAANLEANHPQPPPPPPSQLQTSHAPTDAQQVSHTAPTLQTPVPRKPVGIRRSPPSGEVRFPDKDLPPLNPDVRVQSPHTPRSSSPLRHSNIYNDDTPDTHLAAGLSIFDPTSRQPPSPFRPPVSPKMVPFQLTIIRRDPSTNNQWNIGKVSSVQPAPAEFVAPETPDLPQTPALQDQPAIRVHLETSGYAKFRGFPSRRSIEDAMRDPSTTSLPQTIASMNIGAENNNSGFNRDITMSYTKSWGAAFRKAFKRHDRSSSETAIQSNDLVPHQQTPYDSERPPSRRFLHARNDSSSSVVSHESNNGVGVGGALLRGADSPPLLTKPGPGLKPRGYIFTSPWDGHCEFQTGNGGRTLKCMHNLDPTGSGAGFNPLVVAQNIRDGQGIAAVASGGRRRATSLTAVITGSEEVSELRFNLPSGKMFRSKHDFHHYRRGSMDSEDDESEDEGIDESVVMMGIGKEKAGGGNRGKRAKLGKLIIRNDGFKMLDLLVAANIGVWWVSWERSF